MSPMQIRRTPTVNAAPTGLLEGQLSVEMASTPPKLWVGVPNAINAAGRVMLGGDQITDAPADGYTYGRIDSHWAQIAAGRWIPLSGTQPNYTATLTPALTTYTNGLAITVVPHATNSGPVTVNLGPGAVPVLRNDGLPLQFEDWDANIPQSVFYYNGAFYASGLLQSQVPIVRVGDVEVWIRTDGNDANDGGANTAARAFRNIQAAWNATVSRFSGAPGLKVVLRLGNSGGSGYPGARLVGFPGEVELRGDPGAPAGFIITSQNDGIYGGSYGIQLERMASVLISGVNFRLTSTGANARLLDLRSSSSATVNSCNFQVWNGGANNYCIYVGPLSYLVAQGVINFDHLAGRQILCAVLAVSSLYGGSPAGTTLAFTNANYTNGCMYAAELSTISWGYHTIWGAAIGPQYTVTNFGVFSAQGRPVPGSAAGIIWPPGHGLFYP